MHITTISNSNPSRCKDLKTGSGTSLMIEYNNSSILFNTGGSDAFIENLKIMQKDIEDIQAIVLSENQYEIAEGYYHLLENHDVQNLLFIPYRFFDKHYTKKDFTYTNITSSITPPLLSKKHISINQVSEYLKLTPGLNLHCSHYKEGVNDFDMLLARNGEFVPDNKYTELYLVANTTHGLVLITGTAITSLENIIQNAISLYKMPIYAILGNFTVETEKLKDKKTQDKLKLYGIRYIGCQLNPYQESMIIEETVISNLAVGDEFFF